MLKNIKFKVIELLYNHKLFGVNNKCWADVVMWSLGYRKWGEVGDYLRCGYCGACMTKEEFLNQTT